MNKDKGYWPVQKVENVEVRDEQKVIELLEKPNFKIRIQMGRLRCRCNSRRKWNSQKDSGGITDELWEENRDELTTRRS